MSARRDSGIEVPDRSRIGGQLSADGLDIDVIIVGAGFGGIYLLHKLRKQGLSVKIFEAGDDIGGVWYWNTYPGARVDSAVPVYEYSMPEVWKDWTWTEKYPSWEELQKYFEHVDKVLDVRKDTIMKTSVNGAKFNEETNRWTVNTSSGASATCKYFIVATGFAAKRHYPDWHGLEKFQGELHHSSFWPKGGVDMKGKKVITIGTGSTGIQLAQEVSKEAASLTVFQRTPNLCLPMQQAKLEAKDQDKSGYPDFFELRRTTFAGFDMDFDKRNAGDVSAEDREAFYEDKWQKGGFHFWLATFDDTLKNKTANRWAYDFWSKKTRARITDPVKRDLLAPLEPPHAFGTKRPSLEQDFYEQMDKPHVTIVDVNKSPIKEVTEKGIVTEDGTLYEADVIALATGFDAVTGGIKNMGLVNTSGVTLSDAWAQSTQTFLGLTAEGYPNFFFLYGPHGPTAFSNGPTCVEVQSDAIILAITNIEKQGIKHISPTKEAIAKWKQLVEDENNKTLFPETKSWYMGANIPGKVVEQLNFPGGFPLYMEECDKALDGWNGFHVVKA